jgi:hypothetical protein
MLLMLIRTALALISILPDELANSIAIAILVIGIMMQFFINPFNSDRENANEFCGYLILLATFAAQYSIAIGSWYNYPVVLCVRGVNLIFVLVNCFFICRAYWHDYKVYVFMVPKKIKSLCN